MLGAPAVARQSWQRLWRAGMQVRSLARHSGLRIQHCLSCSLGWNCGLDLISGPGTPYAVGQTKNKQKKMLENSKANPNLQNHLHDFVYRDWSGNANLLGLPVNSNHFMQGLCLNLPGRLLPEQWLADFPKAISWGNGGLPLVASYVLEITILHGLGPSAVKTSNVHFTYFLSGHFVCFGRKGKSNPYYSIVAGNGSQKRCANIYGVNICKSIKVDVTSLWKLWDGLLLIKQVGCFPVWPHSRPAEVPGPGNEPAPQYWQHWILNCKAPRELQVLCF